LGYKAGMAIDLPIISLSGSREEMGRAHGLALADIIRRFVPMRFAAFDVYAQDHEQIGVDELRAAGVASIAFFREWHPAGYREHCAIAQAAGVDVVDLFTAANMTDMRDIALLSGDGPAKADAEGCSAVLVPPNLSATGQLICGQTWDLNPQDVEFVVAVHRKPDDALETWSVSLAGCPSLVGMNAAGLSIGTTNVKTWRARPGVGYMNILHRMLEEPNAEAAIAVVEQAPRSGAHIYWACDTTEGIEIEAIPDQSERRSVANGPLCRTNHCLQPEHLPLQWEAPSPSSLARLERLQERVAAGGVSTSEVVAMFADRSDGVDSVCRYEEDDQGTATNACMVAIPQDRLLLVCRGPADRGEWQTLAFDSADPR
jgi:isopenicillin-N N-acyltransferase like protein